MDYVVNWFKRALSEEEIETPDKSKLNGYSGRPEIWESMESLYDIRNRAGTGQRVKVSKEVWESQIKLQVADIEQILNRPKRIFHASELKNRPQLRWLIEGEIPERGITVIFGAPETGKSFLALDYSERIAQRRPVIYIAAEGESGYGQRHEVWMKHHKMKDTKLHFIDEPVMLLAKGETDRLIEEAKEYNPDMIVFDTLSQCYVGGDENSNSDMSHFIAECRRICKTLSCAVVLVHHVSKAGGERGASALRGNVDSMIEVDNEDDVIRVIPSKLKDRKKDDVHKLRRLEIVLEPGITSCVLVDAKLVKQKPDEVTPNQRIILEILSGRSFDEGARSSDLQRSSGLSGTTYYRTTESLAKRDLIQKMGKFDPWKLTDTGYALANRLGLNRTV